ncbi:MAG: hypothetical protein WCT14_09740 [Treponemataceae bacterium]
MSSGKMALFFLLPLLFGVPVLPQTAPSRTLGEFVAEGTGSGTTAQQAIESAKISAVNALVKSVIKRDTVYRDLLMSEAFKNNWFHSIETKESEDKRWEAKTVVRIDEGIVDALYYGRYSTTVGALLDRAEAALTEADPLIADGGNRESNSDLGGAETAYRRAASKADEALRLVGPVEDAVFFSTVGNRKALELKAMVGTLRAAAAEGLDRIKESQQRLAVDSSYKNVLDLLQTVDEELRVLQVTADELYPISDAPRSYGAERLSSSKDRAAASLEALARRRTLVKEKESGMSEQMEYPRVRMKLILDRIDLLESSFRAVSAAANGELFRRSTPVQAAVWLFNHAPIDAVAFGFVFPIGVKPGNEGIERETLPYRLDARAEGSFSVGSGGIWCRTTAFYETERLLGGIDSTSLSQGVDVGFYGNGLFAVGFRWDWMRQIGEARGKLIKALALTVGSAGQGLGSKRWVPLWITTFSWELPAFDGFVLARDVNLGMESVLRPSTWLRLDAGVSSRARELPGVGFGYLVSGKIGFGFRLPALRPILWRVSYEGAYRSPLSDDGVEWTGIVDGAFRFGLEYAF